MGREKRMRTRWFWLIAAAAPALAGVEGEPIEGGARFKVTFSHSPVIAARSVAVAGSWNGWSPQAEPLQDPDKDGRWTATITLPRGRHTYKFVLNGEVWQHDLDNPSTEPDGHSGMNSVLDLGSRPVATAAKRGDGEVDESQLLHDPEQLAMACAVDGKRRLILRVHVRRDDVERVSVLATPRPKAGTEAARRIATVDGRDVWEARLLFDKNPGKLRYAFQLEDGGKTTSFPPGKERFSVATQSAGRFETPEWVRDGIFYQIFPDRFRDGSAEARPRYPARPEGKPWHIDDRYSERWDAEPGHHNFMGGDLDGITEKADYLKELGINTVYLNPIFAAESNHRYDAADYEQIDPALGTLADYRELTAALKQRNMRLVLDCVFNHTGDEHWAFRECIEKGSSARHWSWYFIDGPSVVRSPKTNYRCWWGFGDLPQLNTKNPEVVEHLMKVGLKWLKEGAHGWRLDVPNEVDAINPDFWPEFRRRVKKQDPDCYIVGEIWTDARAWLQGDKFDAVMNYPVRQAGLEFVLKAPGQGVDAAAFETMLTQQLATYPEPALRVQFNLIGSHDTPRAATIADGDLRRVRLSFTFLYAWPGAPVVYYGDEIGLDGGKDPQCRRTYPWDRPDKQDLPTLEHVRALGKLRAAEPALRRGTVRFLLSRGRTSAFARVPDAGDPGRPVVCVLNSQPEPARVEVPLGDLTGLPKSLLGPEARREGDRLVLELPAYGGAFVALE